MHTRDLNPSPAAQRRRERERFARARRAEQKYRRQLRGVARQIGAIIKGIAPNGDTITDPAKVSAIRETLSRYSVMLRPWALAVSEAMVAEVSRRDEAAWSEFGKIIGRNLRREIQSAPMALKRAELLAEQVRLITSLPTEAAARVHKITYEALATGTRAKEHVKEIMRSGKVAEGRAMLIARTETTRTATALVEARARHIGSDGYIWRTAMDSDVRERHRHLEGKLIKWDSPPVAGDRGERAHAGAIYNCRCYPEPVLPDKL